MSTVLVVILLLIGVFVAASIVLGRTTHEVQSAPDTEYLELEGNWIRYRVTGGGPPIVLVHGWLSSGRIWEPLANRLAQRFTVYTLDLSGFGDSDKPISGYGVRYGSRLLYAFCAHFGLTRAVVVGHDIGGAMAIKLAADHPDVVGRLVLVATPADEKQIDLPTLLWLATLPVLGPIFYTLGRFLRPLRRLWMRPFVLDPEDLTEEVVDDAGRSTPAAVTKTLEVLRREIARGRLVRQAGIIKIPVLVVVGEEDQIVDPQAADEWARTVSAEVVRLDTCGHLPMLERTSEFDARVLTFLTGDSRYLDTIAEFPEEMAGEDKDVAVEEAPEEPTPLTSAEPDPPEPGAADSDDRPNVVRKQDDRYPPRDRDSEDAPRDTDDHHDASSSPADEQDAESTAGDSPEEQPRDQEARTGNRGDVGGLVPEVPGDLFEWPESSKETQPWDRSGEAGGQVPEERGKDPEPDKDVDPGEDAEPGKDGDPEGPEEKPSS